MLWRKTHQTVDPQWWAMPSTSSSQNTVGWGLFSPVLMRKPWHREFVYPATRPATDLRCETRSLLLAASPCRDRHIRKTWIEFAWVWKNFHILLQERFFLQKVWRRMRFYMMCFELKKKVMFYKPDWCWWKKSKVINTQKKEEQLTLYLGITQVMRQGRGATCTGTISWFVSSLFYFLPLAIPPHSTHTHNTKP